MIDFDLMREDVLRSARNALYDNLRHSHESLRELLWKRHPEVPDALIDEVVEEVL